MTSKGFPLYPIANGQKFRLRCPACGHTRYHGIKEFPEWFQCARCNLTMMTEYPDSGALVLTVVCESDVKPEEWDAE